jgi:hypothetical protein
MEFGLGDGEAIAQKHMSDGKFSHKSTANNVFNDFSS